MKTALLIVLMVLATPVCMAAQDWKPIGRPITAALDVDAQGHVVHAQLLGKNILPPLQALTEQTTRNWRFVPATSSGKPVPSRTYAWFQVELSEIGGNQQLRLHYIQHGPGPVFEESPAYPEEMLKQLIDASVVMEFTVNGDGSVSDVHVVNAKTSRGVGGAAFYKGSIAAVQQDRFLPELVDGRPVVTHARMTIDFDLQGHAIDPLRHATDAPHGKIGKDNLDGPHFANVPMAVDSPLKLMAAQP
jgi:TonB family protein